MNKGVIYKYGKLNTAQLKVDMTYQRELNTEMVKRIAENFNWLKVNVIKVSHRDGAYYIFDGQHTMNALKLYNGGKDLFVDCKVYEGLTREDEAELFARQNEFKKRVETCAEMKALYTSGDAEIIELKKTIEDAGLICSFTKGQGNNKICCYSSALKIFRNTSRMDFYRILTTVKKIWHGSPESLRKEIICGLYELYKTFPGELDNGILMKKLNLIAPTDIIRNGKSMTMIPGDKKYAYVMCNAYNKGQRANRLDINKLVDNQ